MNSARHLLMVLFMGTAVSAPHHIANAAPGQTNEYRVAFANSSASNFEEVFKGDDATPAGQIPKGAQEIRTQFAGTLIETIIEQGAGVRLARYALQDLEVHLTVNEQPAVDYIAELRRELRHPVIVEFEHPRRVKRMMFKGGLKQSGRAVWGLLMGYRQFSVPTSLSTSLESVEADSNGRYRAVYTPSSALNVVPSVGLRVIGKQKTEYLPEPFTWLPGEAVSDKVVKADHDEVWVYDEEDLVAMQGAGTLFISVAGKAVAYSEGILELERRRTSLLAAGPLSRAKAAAKRLIETADAHTLWEPEISKEHLVKMHAQELKGRSLEQLLSAARAAETDEREQRAQRTPLYMAFQAVAFLYPEELDSLKKTLSTVDVESMTFRVIVAALAQIGNAESQRVLRWLHRRYSKSPEVRVLALSSLSDVREPTPDTVKLLLERAQNSDHSLEKHAAELGVGTMALMLRNVDPGRAAPLNAWLFGQLGEATTEDRQEDMLRAVGNSGAVGSIKILQPFLDIDNKRLRRIAVAALRWNPTPRAESILLGALATDPVEEVRKASIDAFQLRPMTVAAKPVHMKAAIKDSAPAIRLGAVNNLLRMRYRHPDVVEFALERQRIDPDEEIREKIGELLEVE